MVGLPLRVACPGARIERKAAITVHLPHRTGNSLARILLVPLCLMLLVACGDEDDEVATDRLTVPEVTPGASDELPQGIETATIEITDGAFGVEELLLQEDEPTALDVVNNDDEDYTFQIADLVGDTLIPAGATVEVEFTTPTADTYTGRLLAEDGTVLSEMRVIVQAPGAVEP